GAGRSAGGADSPQAASASTDASRIVAHRWAVEMRSGGGIGVIRCIVDEGGYRAQPSGPPPRGACRVAMDRMAATPTACTACKDREADQPPSWISAGGGGGGGPPNAGARRAACAWPTR